MSDERRELDSETRKHLDEAYRQAISLVRTLAPVLGYPCPIADRKERPAPTRRPLAPYGTLDSDK